MQLTPHFTLEEMTATNHRHIDNSLNPGDPRDAQTIENLRIVCMGLEAIRAHFGTPVRVSSGWRSLALNMAVGSSPTSAHINGYAADFNLETFDALKTASKIAAGTELGFLPTYDQLIYEHPQSSKWVHISYAPRLRMENLTIDRLGTHKGFVNNP